MASLSQQEGYESLNKHFTSMVSKKVLKMHSMLNLKVDWPTSAEDCKHCIPLTKYDYLFSYILSF